MIAVGDIVHGQYKLVSFLGGGSFGEVYLAEELLSGLQVAVKVLTERGRRFQEGFAREARLMAQLQHPNIVYYRGAFSEEPTHFLVMEYCAGGSLHDFLASRGPLSEAEARDCLLQIAQGLDYAHTFPFGPGQIGLMHRDLKPQNILLSHDQLKIADFGISRIAEGSGKFSSHVGTPEYMAPEQFDGVYDLRADLYALGVIYYHMLVGRPPFTGSSAQVMHGHINKTPEIPAGLRAETQDLLHRLLAKKPEERVGSAAVIINLLTTQPYPPTTVENLKHEQPSQQRPIDSSLPQNDIVDHKQKDQEKELLGEPEGTHLVNVKKSERIDDQVEEKLLRNDQYNEKTIHLYQKIENRFTIGRIAIAVALFICLILCSILIYTNISAQHSVKNQIALIQNKMRDAKAMECERYCPQQYNEIKESLNTITDGMQSKFNIFFFFTIYNATAERLEQLAEKIVSMRQTLQARKASCEVEAKKLLPSLDKEITEFRKLIIEMPRGKEYRIITEELKEKLPGVELLQYQAQSALLQSDFLTARDKAQVATFKINDMNDVARESIEKFKKRNH